MTGPNFYKIDCEKEVVLQGKSSYYLTIARNESGEPGSIGNTNCLCVILYPQPNTFETHIDNVEIENAAGGLTGIIINQPTNLSAIGGFNHIDTDLVLKSYANYGAVLPSTITSITSDNIVTFDNPVTTAAPGATGLYTFGVYNEDGAEWNINCVDSITLTDAVYKNPLAIDSSFVTTIPNPFDGTTDNLPLLSPGTAGTGYVARASSTQWIIIPPNTPPYAFVEGPDEENKKTRGATIRIDYTGDKNSHLKLNLLIAELAVPLGSDLRTLINTNSIGPFGIKNSIGPAANIDYQEIHLFGYPENYVRTKRNSQNLNLPIESPIYEDRSSFGLIKTNPKLSGNVKITTDSNGDIWLNSFDANEELSKSDYKRFAISSNSAYQKDLYNFFKNGKTPPEIVFGLYQNDTQYLNNQTEYNKQFDNFYNYGVEQLTSKFYDENYSFLAPLWVRKQLPEFFIIFRINHPIDPNSYYSNYDKSSAINNYFKDARIVKTFDLRATSKLGSYIRKIVDDPRFKERPLDISWERDVLSFWNGIAYQQATITGKGEYLYDFFTQDRPIKEFEEFITGGFERNGVINTNLLNLEFLFNDDEIDLYSINRYVGLYVTENQLAEFEIEPKVLGKISEQTPAPKPGVDGEPYSLRTFTQTNPNGIELPINYSHNSSGTTNTTNTPVNQGLVIGKLPLPEMVEDPLRIFYVKDRDDVFKRVINIKEVDYGYPGTTDYVRATQLKLFDNQEDISKYAGVNDIVSQFPADLLGSGNSQLRLHLLDNNGTGVLADDEEIIIDVKKYNDPGGKDTYHIQITNITGTSATVKWFADQTVTQLTAGFVQPAVGGSVTITVTNTDGFALNQQIYIVEGGYYRVAAITSSTTMDIVNTGELGNVAPTGTINIGSLVAESVSGESTYTVTPLNFELPIDNYLTLNLLSFPTYAPLDAWRIEVDYPSIQKFNLPYNSLGAFIDATYKTRYEQFSWKMIASGVGLPAGDAWDYPQYDPSSTSWVSQFSNEGTPENVASALATCINKFENLPVDAWADGQVVYLKSRLQFEEGNSIIFKRKMKNNSVFENLGFYEVANCDRKTKVNLVDYAGAGGPNYYLTDVRPIIVDQPATPQSAGSYFVRIYRGATTTSVFVRPFVDPTSYATASTTGTLPIYTINSATSEDRYFDTRLPFSIDIKQIPFDTIHEQVYTITVSTEIEQLFVGGVKRLRNRAAIAAADGEKYYQDRQVIKTANLIAGSANIVIDSAGMYIGAPVTGNGIPASTIITDVKSNLIVLNNPATITGSSALTIGTISILNDTVIFQQWYQCLKQMYRRMKGWNVQGKLVYSLPYLEQPVYGNDGEISTFTDYTTKSIIQLDDNTQEFFYSPDRRIVAYSTYRPKIGMFSMLPIKNFDCDFFLSDYAYTPTVEAFKYFVNETLADTEELELDVFNNYVIEQTSNTDYTLIMYALDSVTKEWLEIDILNINSLSLDKKIMLNTFYPLYDYDINEYPYKSEAIFVNGNQYAAAGRRNYDRRYLYANDGRIIFPTQFKIKYQAGLAGDTINVQNANYSVDQDIATFNGFAGIQDITSIGDADFIEQLKNNNQFIEAFTYQLLRSEYDRLRENYNKDWATKSQVVPYINKWVQEGTDARDNYYRLNNSRAFGISNISPADNVDFSETALLTQEFTYLDSVPKDYPADLLESSRGYLFAKLSDIAAKNKSWFDLFVTDNTNDWFTKYFSIGYPTELDYFDSPIKKPREERYTFFTYNDGIGQSQTLFRGGKIQLLGYNTNLPNNPLITDNSNFNEYKFSAITRFEPFNPYEKEKPIDIQVYRNDKWKWVLLLITVRIQDYRTQSGNSEYMQLYFMNDILSNSKQNQLEMLLSSPSTVSSQLRNFYPYNTKPSGGINDYLDASIIRPRQGFLGGGYLHLGDKKLGGIALDQPTVSPIYTPSLTAPQLKFNFINIDNTYSFNLLDEVYPIQNNYRINPNLYVADTNLVKTTAKNFGNDGFTFNFLTTYKNTSSYALRASVDSQDRNNIFNTTNITIGAGRYYNLFRASFSPMLNIAFNGSSNQVTSAFIVKSENNINLNETETYHLEGGTLGFQSIKYYLTYGNLFKLFNEKANIIEYFDVSDSGVSLSNSYQLKFISPDTVIKTNVLNYSVDEDKPDEYSTTEIIGYNIVNTGGREYMVRHRGTYEPKTRDIVSFWLRESDNISSHFEKDYLLRNTRIDNFSQNAGIIKNYGFNKVSTVGNIMQIARTSAYQSLYPLIGEIAIGQKDYFVFNSTWDGGVYRNYRTTLLFDSIDGIVEMKEYKSFLASKTMNVPKSFEFHTFLENSEVTSVLDNPNLSVGVSVLGTATTAFSQSQPDANRPKLIINLNLRSRLLRQLLADINTIPTDEFERLTQIAPNTSLSNLTTAEIDDLKVKYFEKNIIQLYEATNISLYFKNQKGIELLNLNLSELDKNRAGYAIDKNCQVRKISDFEYEITKVLDPKINVGFSIAATLKRI